MSYRELDSPQEPGLTRRDILQRGLTMSPLLLLPSALAAACSPATTVAPEPAVGTISDSPRSPEQLSIFPNLQEDWNGNRFTTVKTADGIEKKIWLMGKNTKWKEIEKPLGQVFRFLTEDINPSLVLYNIKFYGNSTQGYGNLFPPESYTETNKTFKGISAGSFNEYERTYNGKTTKGTITSGDIFAARNEQGEINFIFSEFQGEFIRTRPQPQFVLASAPVYGPQIVKLPPGTPQAWEEQERTYVKDTRKPWRTWYSLKWQNPDGTFGQVSYWHQPGSLKYRANIWKFFGPLPYDDIPLI